jgi:hypothetical protein
MNRTTDQVDYREIPIVSTGPEGITATESVDYDPTAPSPICGIVRLYAATLIAIVAIGIDRACAGRWIAVVELAVLTVMALACGWWLREVASDATKHHRPA